MKPIPVGAVFALVAVSLTIGLGVGLSFTPPAAPVDDFRTTFEARTGVHPDSFLAAGSDCEAFHGEPCRLYGGWAPKSAFAEGAPE